MDGPWEARSPVRACPQLAAKASCSRTFSHSTSICCTSASENVRCSSGSPLAACRGSAQVAAHRLKVQAARRGVLGAGARTALGRHSTKTAGREAAGYFKAGCASSRA